MKCRVPVFMLNSLPDLPNYDAHRRMKEFDKLPDNLKPIADEFGLNVLLNIKQKYDNNPERIRIALEKKRGLVK